MPLFQALMHDIYLQKRPLCQGTSKSVPTEYRDNIEFTLLRLMLPSYRNQSIDLQAKWVKSTERVCFIVGFQTDHIWSNSKNKKRRSTFYKFTSKSLCFEFESQTFNPWLVPSFFPFFKFACNTKKTLQLPMFFFFFSFSYMLLDLLLKFFCVCFIDCYPGYVWPLSWKCLHHRCFVHLKFRVWQYDMPCALEKPDQYQSGFVGIFRMYLLFYCLQIWLVYTLCES